MTRIGAGWLKEDKNKEFYIACKIDEEVQPLTLTPDKLLILKPNQKKTEEKQPDYFVDLWKPKQEKETQEAPF